MIDALGYWNFSLKGRLSTASGLLDPLCRSANTFSSVRPGSLTDEKVFADACWALSYLSDGTNDKIQSVSVFFLIDFVHDHVLTSIIGFWALL